MSYSANGKVYTDNALMDEIVYNTKIILSGIVVKNEILALEYETETSLENADWYRVCKDGTAPYESFPFTRTMLESFTYEVPGTDPVVIKHLSTEIIDYILLRYDPEEIPLPGGVEMEDIMQYCMQYYMDNFLELNKYYRSLMGLPEYIVDDTGAETGEYFIYPEVGWLPSTYTDPVDYDTPLHKQPIEVINALYLNGKIDSLIKEYRSFNYSYLRFLGAKKIDLYTARMANRWDILYMPTVNSLVQSRFQELYNINKEMFNRRFYQEAYNASGANYYDEVTIIMILTQTFADIITDVPEWYITRDIFDVRSVQYFLESYGVPYFQEIPLKYQVRIVKNLNKLIMDKSTDVCNEDIFDILGLKDAVIYKYFLYKQRRTDAEGHYIDQGTLEDKYALKFIQVKQGDIYDNYIKNNAFLANYDDVTERDPYWDGPDEHDTVKHKILERDFTIEPSKYIAIETTVNYNEYMKEIKYFMGLILDSRFEEEFRIPISVISGIPTEHSLSNLFLFLSMLTGAYVDPMANDKVIRPDDMNEATREREDPGINMKDDSMYWMEQRHPELFTTSHERFYGFNPAADINAIIETLRKEYVGFANRAPGDPPILPVEAGRYNIDDIIKIISGYYMPHMDGEPKINSIDELLYIYRNNIGIYDTLQNYLHYHVDNKDYYEMVQYVFEQLFTKEFDYGAYTDKETLTDVLMGRDNTLYNFYMDIISETDAETRQENIKSILSSIISTIEYYVNTDNLKYIYSFTPVSSFASLLRYAYLLINVFKSYKIHLIDANVAYDIQNINDTHEAGYDTIMKKTLINRPKDRHNVYDCFLMIIKRKVIDESGRKNHMREYIHVRTPLIYPDDDEYDLDGGRANSTGYESYDAGKANTGIPYSCVNGGTAYLEKDDYWDISGLDLKSITPTIPESEIYDLDGGNIMDVDQEWNTENSLSENFNHIIEGGKVRSDLLVNDSYFLRVEDKQDLGTFIQIADMQGLDYSEDKEARTITLTESWRYWLNVSDMIEKYNNLPLYNINKLKNEINKIKIVDTHTKSEFPARDIPDVPNVDIPESIIIQY